MSEAAFLAALAEVEASRPEFDPVEAALLATVRVGFPGDSRGFARTFAVAHALVLRALAHLDAAGLLADVARDPRTQRTRYALSKAGETLFTAEPEALAA